MADKPDLTPEQLDALEYEYGEEDRDDPRVLTLVAMARDKQAAEEETAMFKKLVTEKMQPFLDLGVSAGIDMALKLVNEKHDAIERAEAAERERDALREELELWRAAALCEAGAVVPIDDAQPTTDAGGAE